VDTAACDGPALSRGLTVWLTGLPSAGKTTIALALAERLAAEGYPVEVLDGDVVRELLGRDLAFTREDRDENVRRLGYIAHLLSRHGVIAVCAVISPYRATRDEVRRLHGPRFFEVHVATPSSVCADRDVKGLYERHRAGEITCLTGVDDPYEAPLSPELVVPAHEQTVDESVEAVWAALPR
jgi:adenylylsulfate kinase